MVDHLVMQLGPAELSYTYPKKKVEAQVWCGTQLPNDQRRWSVKQPYALRNKYKCAAQHILGLWMRIAPKLFPVTAKEPHQIVSPNSLHGCS